MRRAVLISSRGNQTRLELFYRTATESSAFESQTWQQVTSVGGKSGSGPQFDTTDEDTNKRTDRNP